MQSITAKLALIKEDHRADYLWQTKIAAEAVGCHPNKFQDWWLRTQRKMVELAISQPGETAAELLGIIAMAEQERTKRSKLH